MFGLDVKELICSASCLGQGPQHVAIGCRAARAKNQEAKSTSHEPIALTSDSGASSPDAAGEESTVPDVVPDQLQGRRRILDVSVGEQQQVPQAAGRRQQAEGLQGAPQLCAAPLWKQTLPGGEAEKHHEPDLFKTQVKRVLSTLFSRL